jgi:hypothetical protein
MDRERTCRLQKNYAGHKGEKFQTYSPNYKNKVQKKGTRLNQNTYRQHVVGSDAGWRLTHLHLVSYQQQFRLDVFQFGF